MCLMCFSSCIQSLCSAKEENIQCLVFKANLSQNHKCPQEEDLSLHYFCS